MIQINKIIPQTVEAFDPDGNSLGFLNDFEFNDLRIQIMKEKVDGYYMMFNEERIDIDCDRGVYRWCDGFFDTFEKQLGELIGLKYPKK